MDQTLHVQVPGGAEIAYDIAGIGARSYAFLVDWHIRVLAALAWILVALLVTGGGLEGAASGPFLWLGLVPAALIYFLYHPVLEVLWKGRTPGKRYAGVRIMGADGMPPGSGALVIRNVFRLVDSLPAFYALGLAAAALNRQQARIGDLAARTLLVYEEKADQRKVAGLLVEETPGGLSREQRELLHDLLERWSGLDAAARLRLGRLFLQRLGEEPPTGVNELAQEGRLLRRLREIYRGGDGD